MRIRFVRGESAYLQLEGIPMRSFRRSVLWKLRMLPVRRYVAGFDGQRILLDPELSASDGDAVLAT